MIPEIEMMLAGLVFMLFLILCVLTRGAEGRWAYLIFGALTFLGCVFTVACRLATSTTLPTQ
jgi:hypothetical protein